MKGENTMDKQCFYFCTVCGNIVEKVHDSGNELMCCMRTMMELKPGEGGGNPDHHIPICKVEEQGENTVKITIGKDPHPMEESHYIQWVQIITDKGEVRRCLKPGDKPEVTIHLCEGEKIKGIYSYCNMHKLWEAKCD